MEPINNFYSWTKHMRKVRRWRPGGALVLALRGAELVRERPSEVLVPTPEPKDEADTTTE